MLEPLFYQPEVSKGGRPQESGSGTGSSSSTAVAASLVGSTSASPAGPRRGSALQTPAASVPGSQENREDDEPPEGWKAPEKKDEKKEDEKKD